MHVCVRVCVCAGRFQEVGGAVSIWSIYDFWKQITISCFESHYKVLVNLSFCLYLNHEIDDVGYQGADGMDFLCMVKGGDNDIP